MTQPVEPTPGASATEPTQQPVPQPQGAPPTEPAPAPGAPFEGEYDADRAAKLIENLRADLAKEKSKREQGAGQARQELIDQVKRSLGLGEDVPLEPEQLTAQIADAQNAAFNSAVELQVYRLAGRLGANADALLDSRSFLESLADMDGDDPRADDFQKALEAKVQAALERNAGYRAAVQGTSGPSNPKPDLSQGSRGTGPDADSQIAEAQKRGDWRTVISLQNEKLTNSK